MKWKHGKYHQDFLLMAQLVKNPSAMHEIWVRFRLGRSPGERNDNPLQYSGLGNFMDCIVHRVTKSWTGMGNFSLNDLIRALG